MLVQKQVHISLDENLQLIIVRDLKQHQLLRDVVCEILQGVRYVRFVAREHYDSFDFFADPPQDVADGGVKGFDLLESSWTEEAEIETVGQLEQPDLKLTVKELLTKLNDK